MQKIESFTDLIAWKEAHGLALLIYKLTEDLPKKELFSLIDQMRRSSPTELQNQLLITRDIMCLPRDDFNSTADKTVKVSKLLNGLRKSLKRA